MEELKLAELSDINGGGIFRDIYEDFKYLCMEALPDFCEGFMERWNEG